MLLCATVKPFRVSLVEPAAYLGDSYSTHGQHGSNQARVIDKPGASQVLDSLAPSIDVVVSNQAGWLRESVQGRRHKKRCRRLPRVARASSADRAVRSAAFPS